MAVRPRHRRGRGQHFLRSSKLAAELVRAAGIRPGDLVLDLGAGTGALDRSARTCRRAGGRGRDRPIARREPAAAIPRCSGGRSRCAARCLAQRALQGRGEPSLRRCDRDPAASTRPRCAAGDRGRRRRLGPRVQAGGGLARDTQLSAYWGAWFELSLARRLPRCVFAPPPSVDAGVLRIGRRETPLVPRAESSRL